MLTLNDGRSELWQWDTGRKLTVDADCSQVHFSNKIFGRSIDVNVVDGVAIIPDVLLQTDKDFTAWAFVGTPENGYTKISKVFKVNKRNKPSDYVFTPPEQTTLWQIMERLDDLEANQDPEAIENAVKEYLENNPIKEEDPTVPQWAKEKEKPTYTADEVGALPKTTKIPSKTSELENDSEFAKQTDVDKLSEEIVDLKVGVDKDTITEAVYDYLAENPVEGNGLTSGIKSALMTLVENIGLWKDGNGQKYIDDLRTALYTAPLSSISAVYTQTKTVYASDDLEVLKEDLVVTGAYADGSSSVITDYTLSGTFTVGTSTITVSKDGKTATFEVTVTASRVPATGITLDKTTLSFTGSAPIQLTATVEPSNSTDTVVWSSSEEAVATVDENGLVTPVSDGSCTIYATAGDFTAECSVSVTKPLNGINIGNPYTNCVNDKPSSVATTEEEAQGKWYKKLFDTWTNTLNLQKTIFLHPFTDGTFYIRMVGRTLSDPIEFYAFANEDIGMNPTATLGKVGTDYTDATVTKYTSFDCECADTLGRANLGEWSYVDGSGTTHSEAFVTLYKVVVPEDVHVFMCTSEIGANRFPGVSENYPYMNDLYTIFDSDPSANIMQIVE